nr:sensor domain-containing diguanylate cyclase [Duganella vulcania]
MAANPMLIVDRSSRTVWANHAYERLVGSALDEIRGAVPGLLHTDRRRKELFRNLFQTVFEGGTWVGELFAAAKDKAPRPFECVVTPLQDGLGRSSHFLVAMHDVSVLRSAIEQMSYNAHHDALTGLANRPMLQSVLAHAISHALRSRTLCALLFIDLDGFKAVNDEHGHHVGDGLLIEVAQRLQRAVREADTVCRLAGDEFAIVLDEIAAPAGAVVIANKILELLSRPMTIDGRSVTVGASIGIAIIPHAGDSVAAALRNADAAMYSAKRSGKNRACSFNAVLGSVSTCADEPLRDVAGKSTAPSIGQT